ncbi:MAG: methyltransferase domain-containing protein [Acidobacteriota bacterium]
MAFLACVAPASLRVTRAFRRRILRGAALSVPDEHASLTPAFARLLRKAVRPGSLVADLGTGEGRAALGAAARMAQRVIGLDRDAAVLEGARARARELGFRNVDFRQVDLEQPGLLSRHLRHELGCPQGFDAVLAHLCVSDRILKRAATLVRRGGWVLVTALHSDHWYETGLGSRFAYTERELVQALRSARLMPLELEIDTVELKFPSLAVLKDLYLGGERNPRLRAWRQNGRWRRLEERFSAGRRTLTISRITALAEPGRRAASVPAGR